MTFGNDKRRERFFRFAPLVLWIGVILLASSTQGSMSETSRFIRPLLEFLFPDADENTLILYHALIRKTAHFVEYAMLAFLAWRAFRASPAAGNRLRRNRHAAALLLVLVIASVDELNQSFNTSRTGSAADVLLDLFGGAAMILTVFLFERIRARAPDGKKTA